MKIGFWFDYDQTWTFTALFAALARRRPGLSACGFVVNDRYWADAKAAMPENTTLVRLYDAFAAARKQAPSPADLESFRLWDEERKLARVAFGDRYVADYDHAGILALTIQLKKTFEAFLEQEKPDVFVFNCIASLPVYLLYEMLVERRIQVIVPTMWGLEDLFYITDNPFIDCPDAWNTYAAFKEGRDTPTREEIEFARGFVNRIRAHRPAYDNAAVGTEQRKFRLPTPIAVLRYLNNHYRYYRSDPTQPGVVEKAFRPFKLRWRRRQALRYIQPAHIAEERPFIYFPLHYEPELATLVISPCNQTSVIDLIARRIPMSWRLLLKEHPAMAGQRDPAFYATIVARYPNVAFIDPRVPSLDLVGKARLVFTLNGTTAIEAAAMEKPVIVQARSRFGGFGVLTRLADPFAFDVVLQQALDNPPRRSDVELMLAACRRFGHRVRFAEPLADPTVLHADNIAALADIVLQRLDDGATAPPDARMGRSLAVT